MTNENRERGPNIGERNRQRIIEFLIDARQRGHEGKTPREVARYIGTSVECARDHLNFLRDRYEWNDRSGGVVRVEKSDGKNLWYITDEYHLLKLADLESVWRRKAIESGGYTQQIILEHYHHVCGGIMALFTKYDINIAERLSADQVRKMDLRVGGGANYVAMAEEHLDSGYRELMNDLRELSEDERKYDREQPALMSQVVERCILDMPFELLAPPYHDPFYSDKPEEVFHKILCTDIAKCILLNARRLNNKEGTIFDYGFFKNSGCAYPRRVDNHLNYFCRDGHEGEVRSYVEERSKEVAPQVAKLDFLEMRNGNSRRFIADSLMSIITYILESKHLKGTCGSCPRPDSVIA